MTTRFDWRGDARPGRAWHETVLYELHVRGHQDWHVGFARSLEMFLNGRGIPVPDPRGQQVTDDSVYPLFSARELVVLQLVERRGGDAEPRRS